MAFKADPKLYVFGGTLCPEIGWYTYAEIDWYTFKEIVWYTLEEIRHMIEELNGVRSSSEGLIILPTPG